MEFPPAEPLDPFRRELLRVWVDRQAADRAEILDLWRRHWENRLGRIRERFRSRPDALLVFNLEDDPAPRIVEFLAGDVALDRALFPDLGTGWPRGALPERREDVLEEVVFVNLDRRTDRHRLLVRELLEARGPRFLRFPAVDGDRYRSTDQVFRDHDLPTISERARLRIARRVEELGWDHATFRAKAGCWVSHLQILDECRRKSPSGWTVVCEDDVRFLCSWPELVSRFRRTLTACPGVELVALSSKAWQRKEEQEPGCSWSDEERDGSVLVGGTDCYAVSHRAAARIVDLMDPSSELIEVFSLDGHLSGLVRDGRISGRGLRGGYWAWCWGRDFATGRRDTDIEPARQRMQLSPVERLY